MPVRDARDETTEGVVVAIQHAASAEIRLDDRIDRVESRVDEHDRRLGDLRERSARVEGAVLHLSSAYERAANVATASVMTDLEVRKSGALADIKERSDISSHRRAIARELVFKGIALLMGIWAIVSSLIAAKC
jgi:hypothetical protein